MVRRLRTIKMKRLTAITCAVILLLKPKGFDCADNTTLPAPVFILPPSRYPPPTSSDSCSYGGLSPSELARLCSTDLAPPERVHAIALLINALKTSPFLLSFLPTPKVHYVLNELATRPSLLNSIAPPNVVCLIDTLCAFPCLTKVVPDRTVCDLITAVVLSPKIVEALRPSTVVCLLGKVSPTALCALPPAVRAALMRLVLSPTAFGTLTPAEISTFVDVFVSSECLLVGSTAPADYLEFLSTIVLSPTFANNVSATRAVDLLCLLSRTAPALIDGVPRNVVDALLSSFATTAHRLPATTLARLMAVLTCSPFSLSSLNPATVALLLTAFSPANALSTVPPTALVQLLIDLSRAVAVAQDAIIGLLYSVVCTLPRLMCDVPPCVRSAYVIRLTSPQVTGTLSIETSVKLIGVLCKNQCFSAELTASSVNLTVSFVVSNDTLLNAIPPSDIVDFVYAIAGTDYMLREIPPENIQKLLTFLNSASSLRLLDSVHYSRLLSCMVGSPYLTSSLSGTQLINVLGTLTSASGASRATPNSVYVDLLTQFFTTPGMLSDISFASLLDLLTLIENQTSGGVFCALPPSVISAFAEFLGANNASIITSLPPADLTALVGLLTKDHCFLAHLSVETLSALFAAITTSPFAVPLEVKIKLIVAVHILSPSVLCSLPSESISNICKSLGSFDVLSGLSTACLGELLATISACSCLISAFDHATIQDLLEYLSTSQSALSDLEPGDVANLMISISVDAPLRTSVPVGCLVRFLLAVNAVSPNSISTTTAKALLESLTSSELGIDGLTLTDLVNLADLLAADRALLAALPPAVMVNLLTTLTNRFAGLSREKIIHLLVAAHSASPCLLCAVPKAVLATLLELIFTRSAIGCLPSEYLAAFVTALSTSPCLMDAMTCTTLECLLGLLSSQPALTAEVLPPHTLADLCTILAMTPSALQHVDVSIIISLLAAAGPKSICAIPPMALYTLLAPLSDAKTVYELQLTVIASLLRIAAMAPCVLDALAGPTLNTVVVKAASSPHLIQHLPPGLLLSFLITVGSSRLALESLRPTTLAHLFTSIADVQPSVLCDTPLVTASALLGAFGSQQAFASLPPPALNGLINVLVKFPNLFVALPLSVLNELLRFFVSAPAVLGSILSCTLIKFLAVLSSMPSLLRALPPSTLVTFIEALCLVSPKFLCAFPAPIVAALFEAIAAGPALATLTPSAVASLVSTLNTSPSLISILLTPLLTTLIAYLSANPCLLSNTPRPELLTFIQNVQSPESIPRVILPVGIGLPSVVISRFGDITANSDISTPSTDPQTIPTGNNTANSNTLPNPIIIHPENVNGTPTVWGFPKKKR